MTKKTKDLAAKIKQMQEKQKTEEKFSKNEKTTAYQIITDVLINLFGPLVVGVSLGICCQNLFETSPSLTVGLGLLGAVSGLFSVVQYAMHLDERSVN